MLGDPIPDPGTVATNRTTLVASGVAEGWPRVAGCCPACGGASLFVGEGGYVTCSMRPCPDPAAVADLLERPRGLDAESVAARLVEVICEMQDQLDGERAVGAALLTAQQMAVRGRDMARADLEALDDARAEVAALARWKGEATAVIEAWEQVHRLLGSPGRWGESKAAATYAEVAALRERLSDTALDIAAYKRAWLADLRAKADECSTVGEVLALIDEAGQ